MKMVPLSLTLAVLVCSTTFAQPPQTRPNASQSVRPGAGGITRPGNGGGSTRPDPNRDSSAEVIQAPRDWPRERMPGQRRTEGQRSTRSEAPSTYRVPTNINPVSRNWYFGINAERAPRGMRITQVVNGSPAHRFGLEIGDYIMDVGGYVVGEYERRFYPLPMAMDYGADSSGWAEILVWNKRTFREELMWVRFSRR